jgi:hypothetical protein
MINLKYIIETSMKYHYFIYKNKIIKHIPSNNKIIVNIKKNEQLILIKLKTLTKKIYEMEKKSTFKTTGGPLYAEINTYNIIDNVIIKNKPKYKNKVYFSKRYLQNKLNKHKSFKWMHYDLKKIANAYINDKLNQKLIAINTIDNIN